MHSFSAFGRLFPRSFFTVLGTAHYEWDPVTKEWHIFRLWMEERPPIWRVDVNILNKQSRTVNKTWSSKLGVGRGAENSSP